MGEFETLELNPWLPLTSGRYCVKAGLIIPLQEDSKRLVWFKKCYLYYPIYTMFQARQSASIVIKARIVVTSGEGGAGQGSEFPCMLEML